MIYENTDNINYIALETANATCDENEIITRLYENNVEITYTINENFKLVHMLYIESKQMNKGHGSNALQAFLDDFLNYNIEIEAVFYLKEWYEKFGFKFKYAIDDMLCYKMKLERETNT